ncbi:MAG: hypothetical protein R3B91_16040 [Planctomycetaceae bacterium]
MTWALDLRYLHHWPRTAEPRCARPPAKQTCVGIVHSHPDVIRRPSGAIWPFSRIFASPVNGNGSHSFLFPIVCNGQLWPFVIDTRDAAGAAQPSCSSCELHRRPFFIFVNTGELPMDFSRIRTAMAL